MKKDAVYQSLGNALHDLRVAEDELFRPNEDAVTLCACNYTRNALNGFLRSFLLQHSFSVNPDLNSDELLALCSEIDSQFNTVSLSPFICRNLHHEKGEPEKNYCLAVEKVNDCFNTTRAVRDIVMAKLRVTEQDFS